MQVEKTYCKFGMLRETYLKNHCEDFYNSLKNSDELIPHLNEIDEQAWDMWETIMSQLAKKNPPPPQGTMEWVQHQNRLRAIADEQVLNDIIYN